MTLEIRFGASPLPANNPPLRTIEVVFARAAHRSGRQADSALAWKPGSNVLSSCGLSDKILQRKSIFQRRAQASIVENAPRRSAGRCIPS